MRKAAVIFCLAVTFTCGAYAGFISGWWLYATPKPPTHPDTYHAKELTTFVSVLLKDRHRCRKSGSTAPRCAKWRD